MRARHEPECVINHSTDEVLPVSYIAGKKIAAFCGIADPESFRAGIAKLGGEVVFFEEFPDHHIYTADNIDYLLKNSRIADSDMVLTTEKDGVKLEKAAFPGLFALRIKIMIDPEFSGWLLSRLSQ